MSLLYGIKSMQQGAGANIPHVLGFHVPRSAGGDTLFEVWNDDIGTAKQFVVGLDGSLKAAGSIFSGPLTSFTGLGSTLTGGLLISASAVDAAGILDVGFGTSVVPRFVFRRARGTNSAPTAAQLGDTLGQVNAGGYGATGFGGSVSFMNFTALENFTDAANGTKIVFGATPTGSIAAVTVLELAVSPQVKVFYDNSNYMTMAVASNGLVTFDSVGSSTGFIFSDPLTVNSTLFVVSTTTPQATIKYDNANYCTAAVSSAGVTTFQAFGASAGFTFVNSVTLNNAQKFIFLDASGGKGYFSAEAGNNFVCFTTDSTGTSQPLWSRVMRQDIGSPGWPMVIYENLDLATGRAYQIAGTQVVAARQTGYLAMTGSPDRGTAYATGTITLAQLAGRVAALQADLTTHGLIGT